MTSTTSAVLLHTQHAFEMLLKAGLVERNVKVFDKRDGRSIGFDRCVNLGREHLGLTDSEAGTLRAIDALRDDEQHRLTECTEGLLYMHLRAAVTLFDDLLQRTFDDRLTHHWPHRILPGFGRAAPRHPDLDRRGVQPDPPTAEAREA